jgi:glutamate dehydrogenase (NADP+)
MINYASGGKESFSGKKVAISGSGNVAQYAALKVIELGGTVVSLSDSKGSIIAEEGSGITPELITEVQALKVARKSLSDIASASEHKITYKEGVRPWKEVKVDVALPCATQNEVSGDEAEALASSGAKFVAEGSNMGCTKEAIDVFEKTRKEKKDAGVWYGPGKFASRLLQHNRPLTPISRQGSQRWWCRCLRSRDGPELFPRQVDHRGG